MPAPKTILFLTAGANTGSEHAFFALLRMLDKNRYHCIVLTRHPDYLGRHPVPGITCYCEESYLSGRGLFAKAVARIADRDRYSPLGGFFRRLIRRHRPGLVYFNTLTLPAGYDFFLTLSLPVIVHGHALQHYLYHFPPDLIINRLKKASRVISSSRAQQAVLTGLCPELQPDVIYPLLAGIPDFTPGEIRQTKGEYGIPQDAFLWIMAATYTNYNKDPDRFYELGKRILGRTGRKTFFLWTGGEADSVAIRLVKNKAMREGNSLHFQFIGDLSRGAYLRILSMADAFLLVSLEESFSLVAAEAICLGKPVLAFRCGGVSEYLGDDNGLLAENFSYDDLADKGVLLMDRIHDFDPARMKVSVSRFSAGNQFANWEQIISGTLHEPAIVGQ